MPSKRKKTSKKFKNAISPSKARVLTHKTFAPMVLITIVLWFLYRSLFAFPVWFDETIGKAVFFGMPVWAYISITGFRPIIDSFRLDKIRPGMLQGLAIGGIFGFITLFIRLLQGNSSLQSVMIFVDNNFWWEMLLAFFTAFWESLFFFSFVMSVVQDRFVRWSLAKKVTLVTTIFMLFHIPNTFLRFELISVLPILLLLTLFAIGQGLLYANKQNGYLLVMTHTIWGMALLVFF
jgi:hypothetical protein